MPEDNAVHLLRGSPAVRLWSRYQATVWLWTLCGIRRRNRKNRPRARATENPSAVSCPHCLQLAGATAPKIQTARDTALQDAQAAHG